MPLCHWREKHTVWRVGTQQSEFLIPESCRWRPLDLYFYYKNKNLYFYPKINFFKYFNVFSYIANCNNFLFLNINNNYSIFKLNKYMFIKWNLNVNICNQFWIISYHYAFVKLLVVYSFSSMSFNQVSTLGHCFDLKLVANHCFIPFNPSIIRSKSLWKEKKWGYPVHAVTSDELPFMTHFILSSSDFIPGYHR